MLVADEETISSSVYKTLSMIKEGRYSEVYDIKFYYPAAYFLFNIILGIVFLSTYLALQDFWFDSLSIINIAIISYPDFFSFGRFVSSILSLLSAIPLYLVCRSAKKTKIAAAFISISFLVFPNFMIHGSLFRHWSVSIFIINWGVFFAYLFYKKDVKAFFRSFYLAVFGFLTSFFIASSFLAIFIPLFFTRANSFALLLSRKSGYGIFVLIIGIISWSYPFLRSISGEVIPIYDTVSFARFFAFIDFYIFSDFFNGLVFFSFFIIGICDAYLRRFTAFQTGLVCFAVAYCFILFFFLPLEDRYFLPFVCCLFFYLSATQISWTWRFIVVCLFSFSFLVSNFFGLLASKGDTRGYAVELASNINSPSLIAGVGIGALSRVPTGCKRSRTMLSTVLSSFDLSNAEEMQLVLSSYPGLYHVGLYDCLTSVDGDLEALRSLQSPMILVSENYLSLLRDFGYEVEKMVVDNGCEEGTIFDLKKTVIMNYFSISAFSCRFFGPDVFLMVLNKND